MGMNLTQLPRASNGGLRADLDYLNLMEAESTWPSKYHFSRINPWQPRMHPIQGLNAPRMGPAQVVVYNRLLPRHFRIEYPSSEHRLQTELFGRAPYIALGRGIMLHVDDNTKLQQGNPLFDKGNRLIMEQTWDRRHFVSIPSELQNLGVDTRKGQFTRMSPQYLQPHDPL